MSKVVFVVVLQCQRWCLLLCCSVEGGVCCRAAVSKIVRVIRQPRGNMLLIGIGGSGRQSLTRLASFICDYKTFQIEVSKHYRKNEFRDGKSQYLHVHIRDSTYLTIVLWN